MGFLLASISFSKSLLIFLVIFVTFTVTCSSTRAFPSLKRPPPCIDHHFSALLHFKSGLLFDSFSATNLSSWNPVNRDCCTWEGIRCDRAAGHVTTLDLSHLDISGNINLQSLSPIHSLQILNLASNPFFPSPIPSALANLTSLTHLNLSRTQVYAQIPLEMSNLTRLVSLDLSRNGYYDDDSNYIPLKLESIGALIQNMSSSLRELNLDFVDMSALEDEGGSQWSEVISTALPNLRELRMFNCSLSGTFHPISKLRFLSKLRLSKNNFSPMLLDSFGNLSSLNSLSTLLLTDCNLLGSIPSWLTNLTKLEHLVLSQNNLVGIVPSSLFGLPSLQTLKLWGNQLSGQLSEFHNSSTSPLETIDLCQNMLQGMIPRSIFQVKKLNVLVLNSNTFNGVLDSHIFKNLTSLSYLDLGDNQFEGSLPIPPPSITAYLLYSNHLSGQIPMSICNASSLDTFEVNDNNFSYHVPMCFGEMSNTLTGLNLGGNSLSGDFFQTFKEGCSLEELDLSQNQLQGKLPLSLANCTRLTILNVSNNQFQDTFPPWVQGLAYLRIFTLRSNNFHGPIQPLPTCQNLRKLQIFDLSFNNFNGCLPSTMFCGWKKMMTGEEGSPQPEYLKRVIQDYAYYYTKGTLRIKRLKIDGVKISTVDTIVDLSRNNFQGKIPESIGTLKLLWSLNMSHNGFTGRIPLSSKNMTTLESLDLSHNKLSGNIPPELADLTFLSTLDLSENQLTGSIPHGKQFSTFTNESFQGNPGLCGPPLAKMCEDTHVAPSPTSRDDDEEEPSSESEYDWKIIGIGFGIGYGVGLGAFYWTLFLWSKGRGTFN